MTARGSRATGRTTTARGSRATGGMTTAMGGVTMVKGGTTTEYFDYINLVYYIINIT